jgi:hypothetical protein
MGAWGTGICDNDTAADWCSSLEDVDDLSLIEEAFENILSPDDDFLDADQAQEALAAAEAISRLQGNGGPETPHTEPMDGWVKQHKLKVPATLARKAHAVIDRVLTEPSELLDLWTESEEMDAWKAAVKDLKSRIRV